MENEIENLIMHFAKLPGIGPRSARRIVLHIIKNRNKLLDPFIEKLSCVKDNIQNCYICNNIDTTNPCSICLDNSRSKLICVVEEVSDLWAIEKGGFFDGLYHVLGGTLSALDGVGPEQLSIDSLLRRIENGDIIEVILANNATVEGKTTAHFLISKLKEYSVKISRLAYGIPIGGEIDYLDEMTLSAAISSRQLMLCD